MAVVGEFPTRALQSEDGSGYTRLKMSEETSQEGIELTETDEDHSARETAENASGFPSTSDSLLRPLNMLRHSGYLPLHRTRCPVPEPVRSSLSPPRTKKDCLHFFLLRLPILSWLWSYKPRYLIGDVIAGITVAVMHIPQGLAYALLANLPPVYGLYTSFIPPLVYTVFGTSRHLSVGTFAVVSLMIGNGVDRLIENNNIPCFEGPVAAAAAVATAALNASANSTVAPGSISDDAAVCLQFKVGVALTITFLSGIIMILMSVLQLGFVSLFLSSALVSGYTTGAAVHVATSQVRHLLGIPQSDLKAAPGPFNSPTVWKLLVDNIVIGNINVATVIISLVSCVFLIVVRNVNNCLSKTKLYKKLPIPIPSQLILVVVATLLSYLFQFQDRWSVSIVDTIERGPPKPSLPVLEHIPNVIQDSITVAIVSFAVGVSLSKVFAKRNKYEVSANQEMLAYGLCFVVGSFFSSFGPSGSLSRSLIQENVGGKTQLVGVFSSVIIFTVLVGIAPLFEPLPKTILASVVIVALYGMFKQVTHLMKYWKTSKFDMMVWLVIFTSTVLLGVDLGLLVGTLFSIALVVFRLLLPNANSLGQVKDAGSDQDSGAQLVSAAEKVEALPGILIFQFFSPLCYLNAGVFRAKLVLKSKIDPSVSEDQGTGCWTTAYNKIRGQKSEKVQEEDSDSLNRGDGNLAVNMHFDEEADTDVNHQNLPILSEDSEEREISRPTLKGIHTIIIDCAAISFVDAVGAETLQQVMNDYHEVNVQVLLVSVPAHVVTMLTKCGFMETFGYQWLFPSIQSAVEFASQGGRLDM